MGVCGQIIKDLPNSSSSSLDRDFLIFLQNFGTTRRASSPSTGKLERNLALSIHSIPKSKLTDSSFWSFLFRLQIYPSSHNGASVLYTKLLPSLNNLPLRANLGSKTAIPPEFKQVPDGKLAESYHNLALLAFTTDASEGANGSHFNTLAITASLSEMAGTPPGR